MQLDLRAPGPASLRVSALLEASGTLQVIDEHIVFTRAPGMSGWGAPAEGPRVPLAAVRAARVSGGAFTINPGPDERVFLGAHAAAVGLGLLAAGVIGPDRPRTPGFVWITQATLHAGALRGAGILALGSVGLRFGTTSGVAEALGVPSWAAEWRWISGLSVSGRRVGLRGADGEVSFEVDDPAGLARMIARGLPVPATPIGPPSAIWLGGGVLQLASGEVQPGVAWVDPAGALRFACGAGERLLGPSDRALRVDGGRRDTLRDHQDAWVLRLKDGAALDAYDHEVVKVIGARPAAGPRADLRLVIGRRERARFRDEQGARPTLPVVWIEDGDVELDLYTTHAAGLPPIGEAVQLIIPTRSGDLRLLTRCGQIDELPLLEAPKGAQVALKGADHVARARLRRPLGPEVQELKDRGGYRHELGLLDARIRVDKGPMIDVQMTDLSASGAAMRVPGEMEVGTTLLLHLPIPELGVPQRVEVVWAKIVGESPQVGVRFMDESEQFRARVQRAIYRMQRAQIELADEEPTHAQRRGGAEDSSAAVLRALKAVGA